MTFREHIDFEKTLQKRRLVLTPKWLDIVDTFVFFFAATFFIASLGLTFKEADLSNPNDKAIAYGLLPIAGLFAIVLMVKKATEKKMLLIKTDVKKGHARELITKAFKTWGWKIHTNTENYLQATTGFEFKWGKQVTVLFDHGTVFINVMSDNPMVRMPVLFSDRSIRHDIKKILEASTQQEVWQNAG